MPQTLYGEAAGLLQGAGQVATGTANTAENARQANMEVASRAANNATEIQKQKMSEQGAIQRQGMAGAQALEQKLAEAKAAAEAERQKYDYESMMTVTQPLVDGAKKAAGVDMSSLVGQRIPSTLWSGLITAGAKTTIAYTNADAKGNKTKSDAESKSEANLLKLEKDINAKTKTLMALAKEKDLPPEVFGGEPGNMRKFQQFISSGQMGNLTPEQKARVNSVKGIMDTMTEQNARANEIRKSMGKEPTDYTGFGEQPGGGADDQAITDFLAKGDGKRPYADNPQNREWAKGQLSGK